MLVFYLKFLVSGPAFYELVTCKSFVYQTEMSRIAERDLLGICVSCISYHMMSQFAY